MTNLFRLLKTLSRLGWWNVCYMAWYRFTLKTNIRKLCFPTGKSIEGPFFSKSLKNNSINLDADTRNNLLEAANYVLSGTFIWFSKHVFDLQTPPDWFLNPFNNKTVVNTRKHWTELSDFDLHIGDIKTIWETSRFHWVPLLAKVYALTGDEQYINTLNEWLKDWSSRNPLNVGPNWKCGQETSIRAMNLILSSFLLSQHTNAGKSLCRFLFDHGVRIEKNIKYAVAQDNNHGTSEGAGLYIIGLFLNANNYKVGSAKKWIGKGKKLLVERTKTLVSDEGSFSQHSTNYHRLFLDTVCIAEYFRQVYNADVFEETFRNKVLSANQWLLKLIDPTNGKVPNMGANDGALLLQWIGSDFLEYRPTVWLTQKLYNNEEIDFKDFPQKKIITEWLSMKPSKTLPVEKAVKAMSHDTRDGYVVLYGDRTKGLIRYPYYRFRPSQCDPLHFDFWVNGENILCDAGSYCYNCPEKNTFYFSSVRAHNTAVFDEREPMKKFSRFLYVDWLSMNRNSGIKRDAENGKVSWSGSYTTNHHIKHRRTVILNPSNDTWKLEDEFSGDYKIVQLYWHLGTDNFELNDNRLILEKITFIWDPRWMAEIEKGWVSRYYMDREPIPILVLNGGQNSSCYLEIKQHD